MAGGGKGGKSKGPSLDEQLAAQQKMMEMSRPKDVPLQTTGWGGMGVNAPQNPLQMGTAVTGQGLAPPSWMQGDWAMPAWGQQAPNVGAAMLQQQDPSAYAQMASGQMQAPQSAQAPQATQSNRALEMLLNRRRQGSQKFGKGSFNWFPDNSGQGMG